MGGMLADLADLWNACHGHILGMCAMTWNPLGVGGRRTFRR